jgi:hypothetical protein
MNRTDLEALDKATLADLVLRQAERIAALKARLAEVGWRFEELDRRAARGAAPFARPEGKRSPSPKRPGRKGGHEGACRVRPPEEAVDRRIEALLETARAEPVLHTDETSWWVGRAGFCLWVLTNRAGTCYRVGPRAAGPRPRRCRGTTRASSSATA